ATAFHEGIEFLMIARDVEAFLGRIVSQAYHAVNSLPQDGKCTVGLVAHDRRRVAKLLRRRHQCGLDLHLRRWNGLRFCRHDTKSHKYDCQYLHKRDEMS